MFFCKNCGSEVEKNAKFCSNCGEKLIAKYSEREMRFDGIIFKCPNCGEILESFIANCPSCGYELRGVSSSSSIKEFADKLQKIESEREQQSKTTVLEKILKFQKATKTDEQKISLIQSFPIPNTKEDLYEFLILCSSNIDIDIYDSSGGEVNKNDVRLKMSDAWKSKFEQAYQKAKLIFRDDVKMADIQKIYDNIHKQINKSKNRDWKQVGITFGIMIGIIVVIYVVTSLIPSNPEEERQRRLEYLIEQIEDDIINGNCESAKNKAYTLTFDETLDSEKHKYWEKKQKEILDQIEKACNN